MVFSMRNNRRNYARCGKREIHCHYHENNISDIRNSTIVQGNTGETIVVHNGMLQLSERELELVRIFRLVDERKKNEAMTYFFSLEDGLKGGGYIG